MDCATEPLPKPSNISNMVSKFSKICKLRSIGVISSENNSNITENSSESTEEMECAGKIHPFLVENQSKTNPCDEMDLSKLFDIISIMKLAYIQLQEAHIPYDVDKITAANELVVAKFRELYNIKQWYKEKKFKDMKSFSNLSNGLVDEIRVQEKLVEKIEFQVKAKNTELLDLHKKLAALNLLNAQMDEKLKKKVKENIEILEMSSSNDVFAATSRAFHDFAKPLISLMKASGWDLDQAANSVESSVFYSKRSHKKFAFEAYIALKMLNDICHPCNIDCVTRYNDPMDDLMENPNSNLARFCRIKYLSLIHPTMEASFFGNLDNRTFVSSGKHPRTPFYQAFVKMAWRVWVLRGITLSSDKKVEIFGVKRGTEFSEAYMESVVDLNEEMVDSSEKMSRFKVEFMVIPGFKIGNVLIKSQVYLSHLVG